MFNNLKREIEKDFDREKNFDAIMNKAGNKHKFNWKYAFAPAFVGIVLGIVLLNIGQTMKKDNLKLQPENIAIANENIQEIKKEWIVKRVASNPELITTPAIVTVIDWEKKSSAQKFYNIEYDGRRYNGERNTLISEDKINQDLGEFTVTTLNSETSATVEIKVHIYKIKNVIEEAAIAVKFEEDDNYYVYRGLDYIPDNLSEIINDLDLRRNATFDYVTYYEWFGEGKLDYNYIEFIDVEDEVLWDFIKDLDDSTLKAEDRNSHKRLMGININLESLGLGKLNFITILEGGYVSSTMLANRCYYIGEDKTQEFMDYIMEKYDGYIYVWNDSESQTSDSDSQTSRIMTIENKVGAEPQEQRITGRDTATTNTTMPYNPTNSTIPYNP